MITLGNDQRATANKFINYSKSGIKAVLLDLDKPAREREAVINSLMLNSYKDACFFMIMEMEAWFLSQPFVLDKYYGQEISKKIPKKPVEDISDPSSFLREITKTTIKGRYHKVRDGVRLLMALDANKLYDEVDEFKNMINYLTD